MWYMTEVFELQITESCSEKRQERSCQQCFSSVTVKRNSRCSICGIPNDERKARRKIRKITFLAIVTLSTLFLLGIGCRLYSRDEKLGEHVRKTREHNIPSYMRYPCDFTIIKARWIPILYQDSDVGYPRKTKQTQEINNSSINDSSVRLFGPDYIYRN